MPYRPTERTEARRAAAREQIVAAARALIARGGYREAQAAAAAARAGVATGTVYRHFPSKAELFAEVFRRVSGRKVEATRAAAADAAGATARLAAAIEAFARRALRARRQAYALLAEPVDPAVEAERLRFRRAHAEHFAAIVSDGVDAGELPPQNAAPAGAALVGALAEPLAGPLSDIGRSGDADALVSDLVVFCLRSVTDRETAAH